MVSIGELSRATGVKVPTIRYYEEIGILDSPDRTDGNQRRYDQDAIDRLAFIRHARDLGLPISAVRSLIELTKNPDRPCAEADGIAKTHLDDIELRIARLVRLKQELGRILSSCNGGTMADCNVIGALADHSRCNGEH